MILFKILITLALIFVMVYFLSKKYNGPMVLLSIGIITLLVMTAITGTSAVAKGNTGSLFLDVFELVRAKLQSNISGSILLVMCVFGYMAFMKAIKADKMMVYACVRPLSKVKNKSLLLIGGIILATLVKLVIAGHSGTTALLIATLYPILVAAGVSKESAGAAIVIGGTLDIGPSEPNAVIFLSDEFVGANTTLPEFFINYQIIPGVISTVVIIILAVIVNRYFDKKDNTLTATTDISQIMTESADALKGVPKIYGLFPVLPLALIIIFNFVDGITLSAHVANLLCFVAVFIIHVILRRGARKESFNLSAEFFKGMGNAVATVGALVVTGTVFSAGLEKVGGIQALLDLTTSSNFSGGLSVLVVAFMAMFVAFACATGTPAMTTVLSIMPNLVSSTGINALTIAAPVIMASGNGRALALVCPAVLITSGYSGVSPITLFKRNLIPAIGGTLSAVIASLILCA